MSAATAPPTIPAVLTAAQQLARTLGPVLPLCYPDEAGACACGGGHSGHDIGKAPIGSLVPTGVKGATTNSATIDRWWRAHPQAGVGLDLERAGLIFIDPDSPAALDEAVTLGVDGGMPRASRNVGYLFKRPDGCPTISITKAADQTDLEIRATGYVVVQNTHADGTPVRLDLGTPLVIAPSWATERLARKAARTAEAAAAIERRRAERTSQPAAGSAPLWRLDPDGLARWNGALTEVDDAGQLDRSRSLWRIGLAVAAAGASEEGVRWAIEDRDIALGWGKYAGRPDAEKRYTELAEKAVAHVLERGRPPTDPPPRDAIVEQLESARAELTERVRLISDVLARPSRELSASHKVMTIAATLLMHSRMARGIESLPASALMEAAGVSKNTACAFLQDMNDRTHPLLYRRVTRRWFEREDGTPYQETVSWTVPRFPTVNETLAAIPRMGELIPDAVSIKKKKRPREPVRVRQDVAFGQCSEGDNDTVRVVGTCPRHDEVVGEAVVRREDFELLGTLNTKTWDSAQIGYSAASVLTLDTKTWDSAPPPDWLASWPEDGPWLRLEAPAPTVPPCIRPGCGMPCGPGDQLLCVAHRAEAVTGGVT